MKPKLIPAADEARIRILVADDHPVVRDGIVENVKPQGDMTVVAQAGDGAEALALIKMTLPDVVLLDLRMPFMDGLDVLTQVNKSQRDKQAFRCEYVESTHLF